MQEVFGWAVIAIIAGMVPTLLVLALRHTLSTRSIEEKYRGTSGGLVGGFDAVWSPSAHEAAIDRDSQQRQAIPAPTPDKGPGRITDEHRITIDLRSRPSR